jgi:hypothetical protein
VALLTAEQRQAVWNKLAATLSRRRDAFPVTKADGKAVIAAVDQWQQDNQASFNSVIPLPARTVLTTKLKLEIFQMVAEEKWGAE